MVEIRRILCPTDFSDVSRHALEHAVVVARWYESHITALHVGNPMMVFAALAPIPPGAGEMLSGESSRQTLEDQVRGWLSPVVPTDLQADVIVDEGNPARCILDRARTLPADLIVIGTHGQSGFERLALGSVAEKVLRKATCPVMTVPPRAAVASKLPFTHVMCPVDFSDSSLGALEFAFSLAQESNARVTLVHVLEWLSDEPSIPPALETSGFRRQWEAETRARLEGLIPADVQNWCAPVPRLVSGKAYQQILSLAASERVDLIVMGVRGRNALDMMLFGSTTNQVVRQAPCPVLTLKGRPGVRLST